MIKSIISAAIVFLFTANSLCYAKTYHLIISGSGGEQNYEERFESWGNRLRAALSTSSNVTEDELILLNENGKADKQSRKEIILKVFENYSSILKSEDSLIIYLIGHGSFYNAKAKLYLPGEDLRAEDLSDWLNAISARHIAIINTSSSSAPFINVLSAPNRIICTATKSEREVNATEFMEWFIEGIEDLKADRNYDEGVTIWEACLYAAEQTQAWYKREGFISTEHPILDDNGDGLGSRFIDEETMDVVELDGILAKQVYIRAFTISEHIPIEWVNEYREIIGAIEGLKEQQSKAPSESYYCDLEKYFIKAATIRRSIRKLETEGGGQIANRVLF
jgi:hypothetical protein